MIELICRSFFFFRFIFHFLYFFFLCSFSFFKKKKNINITTSFVWISAPFTGANVDLGPVIHSALATRGPRQFNLTLNNNDDPLREDRRSNTVKVEDESVKVEEDDGTHATSLVAAVNVKREATTAQSLDPTTIAGIATDQQTKRRRVRFQEE